jgi:hypothetical protein
VFEDMVLRRMFGLKREEEVAIDWRRLHIGELHNLYASLRKRGVHKVRSIYSSLSYEKYTISNVLTSFDVIP